MARALVVSYARNVLISSTVTRLAASNVGGELQLVIERGSSNIEIMVRVSALYTYTNICRCNMHAIYDCAMANRRMLTLSATFGKWAQRSLSARRNARRVSPSAMSIQRIMSK